MNHPSRTIDHLVATVDWPGHLVDELRRAVAPGRVTHHIRPERHDLATALGDADVVFLAGDPTPDILRARSLRWVHCDHAGIDRFAPADLFGDDRIVTTAAGRSAPALAEHVLMFILALSYDLPRQLRARQRHIWRTPSSASLHALRGRTVLIVGAGHTGTEVAKLCRAFGMRTIGYRRSRAPLPPAFDSMHCADDGTALIDLLGDVDIVVLAASLNDRTHHMIGGDELAAMHNDAILVNVGRGGLIDQDALIDALRHGTIGGAGLDVTDPEPPGIRSPLWRCPRLILTPHHTPPLADRTERSARIALDNVARYLAGDELHNRLGPDDAYTRGRGVVPRWERRLGAAWQRVASRTL